MGQRIGKHTAYDLAQMQSLPLEKKIEMSERRITEWYEHWDGQVYVSRSGGKDSDVLGHLVKRLYPDVPQVFVNTGLEYDSVRIHGTEIADTVLKPSMSFLEVITKYGYPVISKEVSSCVYETRNGIERQGEGYCSYRRQQLQGTALDKSGRKSIYNHEKWGFLLDAPFRISNQCCNVMKKKPAKRYAKETGRKPFIGTMASESRQRKSQWIKNGCNGFDMKSPVSNPISFWTEQDVLQYILKYSIELAEAYGQVVGVDNDGMYYSRPLFIDSMKLTTTKADRTGCVFCMFGITQDTERFLRLKELEPKKYDYVMRGGKFDEKGLWIPHNGLGYKFVIDWLNEHGDLDIKY